jgi:hypothetical protein
MADTLADAFDEVAAGSVDFDASEDCFMAPLREASFGDFSVVIPPLPPPPTTRCV